jgi:large subunit ribosomal protein L20
MNGLRKSGAEINRKMLADMAVREPEAFANLVTIAKGKIQDQV